MQRSPSNSWASERSAADCLGLIGDAEAVLIRIAQAQGSTPREQGCWMLVTGDLALNTIGGGHLEFEAIAIARDLLNRRSLSFVEREFKLGPALGQCCGGALRVEFHRLPPKAGREAFLAERIPDSPELFTPVAIVGGGHVGHATVQALLPLPFRLTWIDSREGVFPEFAHFKLTVETSDEVVSPVVRLDPKTFLLVMSFTHAEDFEVIRAALLRRRREPACFPFIGLIGSQTKWARFRHRLLDRGFNEQELAAVTSPIGISGIYGKEPAVIAASVVAQLLLHRASQPIH